MPHEDPFYVLSSTKEIVENLKFIVINENSLEDIARIIAKRIEKGLDSLENHFGSAGKFEDDVQLIFLEDTVNFCFWAEKDKPKWQIEWPKGHLTSGGWYTLTKCFQRALAEKIPILNAEFLINLTIKDVEHIFRSSNNTTIPLLEKRLKNLQEAGRVLKNKYSGKFANALEQSNYDVIKLVNLICKEFPSFRDVAKMDGKKIYFLKRAQICSQDFFYLRKKYSNIVMKNTQVLTAFADYKIPQMLRKYNVITYKDELAQRVDNYVLIPAGSREEIEIRCVSIWCIELIRQKLKKYTASDIDNALWLISQNQSNIQPYHRTYTIFY